MKPLLVALLVVWVSAYAGAPAHAADSDDEDLRDCATRLAPGSRIDICTDIIEEEHGQGHRASLAYEMRGNAYLDLNRFDDAIADFTRSVTVDPANASGYMWRCVARARKNDRSGSEDCDKAVELAPNSSLAAFTRAKMRARFNDDDGALADYSRAIELDPRNAGPLAGRGSLYVRRQQADLALADLNRALTLRPGDAQALYDRGLALGMLGRPGDAETDFSRAIALEPGFEDAYLARALARSRRGDYAEAYADVEVALKINPKSERAHNMRAMIRDASGGAVGEPEAPDASSPAGSP